MASAPTAFKSREEWKAAKELEEARKAGTAPPAVDEEGKIINPHIPEYISQAPWYLNSEGPSLKHQKNQLEKKRKFDSLGKWLPRGQKKGPAATKYRKGACENCGAMTHNAKNCLERPRKRGAKLTGRDIQADEVVGDVNLDFEGKRDRWNGYEEEKEYQLVHQRYAKIEAERKALKAEKLDRELRDGSKKRPKAGDDNGSASLSDSDSEDGDAKASVMQQQAHGSKMSVRNLRIREDTAKYLYNLKLDSAYYDPKSRSMRADPTPGLNPDDKDFAGDNFVRFTGDVAKLAQMELHTIRGASLGQNLPHLQAEPSRAEALFKDIEGKKKRLEERRKAAIIDKYGGQEHTKAEEVLKGVGQTEAYVEYGRDGRVLKGTKPVVPVSKYPEGVLEDNHTAIWGSFYKDGRWGYACCHQVQRHAYCTGDDGKKAAEETEKEMAERVAVAAAKRDTKSLVDQWKEKEVAKEAEQLPPAKQAELERKKQREIEKEMRRQEREEKENAEDDRGRGYNSLQRSGKPEEMTETVMEAYRLRRQLADDPMAKFLSESKQK